MKEGSDPLPEVAFNWDDLTVGEVIEIEEISGLPIDELQKEGTPKGKVLLAMMFVVKKREDPDFTVDQARSLPVAFANDMLAGGVEERPTSAAGS